VLQLKSFNLMLPNKTIASLILLVLSATRAFAGDAVVIGYNADGMWTAVTYCRSFTPNGGGHYKDQAHAREQAFVDLRRRGAGMGMVTGKVLAKSDLTGFVTVARGTTADNNDVTVVGHARSQQQADTKAVAQLNGADAHLHQRIVYRYFSYGADSNGKR